MSGPRPKKRFSQNFLADKNIAGKIIDCLDINHEDIIFEIGSGRGTLTSIIADKGARLYTFEIDRQLIDNLNNKFGVNENVVIVNRNFLDVDPTEYIDGKFKLIGNIPYDITSPLLDWMINYHTRITRAVITTQRELANRISASPGSRDWAPVSIFCQSFFRVKAAFNIPPKAFYPPPKVNSTTLIFEPVEKYFIEDREYFELVVRNSFKHRRKFLVNNLSDLPAFEKETIAEIIKELGYDKKIRAEQLDIPDFINLANKLKSIIKS
jgi:16S rRNA (adenine1518-N6/adenine1519-N6)-dimethyltransferase